ncbi:hypothetical protein FPZ41_29140 [Streptomyces sp. K1PN6]|uniref:Uncharacterized protein n=1 Tax=Streptomyces acidicola TaxID=2596892 RepID=A0A5N8X0Q9_9ACTN|nr:hypothetical protein [Streptomyces acidicola]
MWRCGCRQGDTAGSEQPSRTQLLQHAVLDRESAGWGARGDLEYHPVRPDRVAEFVADTAIDDGLYRHPVRFLRLRDDLTAQQVPPFRT